jgi:hypothetical protein
MNLIALEETFLAVPQSEGNSGSSMDFDLSSYINGVAKGWVQRGKGASK